MPTDSAALLAADPKANSDYQWVREAGAKYDRDDVLQYFVNIHTGIRCYGRTDGFDSDKIHLRFRDGTNSGLNLDPVSGDIKPNGNAWGDVVAVALMGLAMTAGGALGAGASIDGAKNLFDSTVPHADVPAGLLFPPLAA